MKQIGHSFKLRLPNSMKVHPVFHAEKLRRAPEDPLLGQRNPEPPPLQVNNQDEYEVEQVLAVKLVRGKLKYRVKWKGYDDDPEFYLASALRNSPLVLQQFYKANPYRPGPPANLDYWLECAQQDKFPEERNNDDKAV